MVTLSFRPAQITRKLVSNLDDRARNVILSRFGIGEEVEEKTLEAIGNVYSITRERVRQIENASLNSIRKGAPFASIQNVLTELKSILEEHGRVAAEDHILGRLAPDEASKNHLHFLLVLGSDFEKIKEDDEFSHIWTIDTKRAEEVRSVLGSLHKKLKREELIPEGEMIPYLKKLFSEKMSAEIEEEIVRSWLTISKIVFRNILGEWGHVSSPSIKPRGMRDLAFLVLKKQGSPMHFSEVTKSISELFTRKAHPETVHNELIKDERFILVGRGLYALNEWGYKPGVIREVIRDIIKSSGPLSKEEIIKRVLKERYVKENTILVNLQNKDYFKRNAARNYTLP